MRRILAFTVGLLCLAGALTAVAHQPGGMSHATPENILPVSKGVYRLPYPDGSNVTVTGDHVSHNPHLRTDMVDDTSPTNIVAAADGWIEYIQDGFDLTCPSATMGNPNPCNGYSGPSSTCCVRNSPGCNCNNNYLFLRHPNGEWTKYSHVQFNTVPASLQVGDFVTAGTVLGLEGDVGFASGSHIHFEVGVPDFIDDTLAPGDPGYDPLGIDPPNCSVCSFLDVPGDDAILADTGADRQNRIPVFCQIGFVVDDGSSYVASPCNGVCDANATDVGGTVVDDTTRYEQGSGSVDSDLVVEAGGGAAIKAAVRVRLLPGFHAEAGSFFAATIGPCDFPGF